MHLVLSSLSLLMLVCTAASALECEKVEPGDGVSGYRMRSRPDRCEGFYTAKIAGETLEWLSFVRRPIAFDADTKAMSIIAPATQALGGKPVLVTAHTLPPGKHYRMDAQVPSGASLVWPIADVVIPNSLTSGDVGVIGRVTVTGGDVYVPLDVSGTASKAESAGFLATFRAATDLELFQWRLYDPSAPPPLPPWQSPTLGPQFSRGEPIVIRPDGPSGTVLTLDVRARTANDAWVSANYKILLP